MSLEAWGDDGDADRPYTEERVEEMIEEAAAELKAENKRLREALFPRPEIKDCIPVVLYFGSREEADEFIALVQEAKPGMKGYKL